MGAGHTGKGGKAVQKIWYMKGTNDVLTRVRFGIGKGTLVWAMPTGPGGTWQEVPLEQRELRADILKLES